MKIFGSSGNTELDYFPDPYLRGRLSSNTEWGQRRMEE